MNYSEDNAEQQNDEQSSTISSVEAFGRAPVEPENVGKWRDRLGGEHEGSPSRLLNWAGEELPEYMWMHTGEHGVWSLLTKAGAVIGFDPTSQGAKFAPPPETPTTGAAPYFFTAADDLWAWDVQPRWVLRKIPDPRKVHGNALAA